MQKKHIGKLLFITVAMALFRTTVVIFNMETDLNDSYHLRFNYQTITFAVAAIICLGVLLVLAVYSGRGKTVTANNNSNVVFVTSCMLAFMLAGAAAIFVVSHFMSVQTDEGALDILSVALAIATAAALLCGCLRRIKGQLNALLMLAPLFWSALRLINDFMKTNTSPLDASGAYHILSLVYLVMFFMCQGKAFLGKGSGALYLSFGYGAVFFLAVYALPNLIMHCLGFFVFDYEASLSVMDLAIAAYAVAALSSAEIKKAE